MKREVKRLQKHQSEEYEDGVDNYPHDTAVGGAHLYFRRKPVVQGRNENEICGYLPRNLSIHLTPLIDSNEICLTDMDSAANGGREGYP